MVVMVCLYCVGIAGCIALAKYFGGTFLDYCPNTVDSLAAFIAAHIESIK